MRVESPTADISDTSTFVARNSGQTEALRPASASLQALWKISALSPSFQEPHTRTRFRSIIDCCDSPKDLTWRLVAEMGARTALELKEVASRIGEGIHFSAVLAGVPEPAVRRILKWGRSDVEELRVKAAQEEEERGAMEREQKRSSRGTRLEIHKESQEPWTKRSEEAGKPVGKDSYKDRGTALGQRRKLKRRKGSQRGY